MESSFFATLCAVGVFQSFRLISSHTGHAELAGSHCEALLGQSDITGRIANLSAGLYPRAQEFREARTEYDCPPITLAIATDSFGARHRRIFRKPAPASAGMSAERLSRMNASIEASIEKEGVAGRRSSSLATCARVWRKAYGARAVEPQREDMTAGHESLTSPV